MSKPDAAVITKLRKAYTTFDPKAAWKEALDNREHLRVWLTGESPAIDRDPRELWPLADYQAFLPADIEVTRLDTGIRMTPGPDDDTMLAMNISVAIKNGWRLISNTGTEAHFER